MADHSDLVARVMAQRDAVKDGSGQSMPLSLKLVGSTGDPEELAERIGDVLGRPVKVTIEQVVERKTKTVEQGDAIQKYYEDAARRGARTGD